MIQKKYFSEQEVSVFTGRAVKTLQNDRYQKIGIPYIKILKQVRYNIDDVVSFMEKNKIITYNN